jgi:uncharacterized membrane protein
MGVSSTLNIVLSLTFLRSGGFAKQPGMYFLARTNMSTFTELVGRVHPLVVHFPIGLLFAGGVLELVRLKKHSPALGSAALWSFGLGAGFAGLAALTGWILEEHSHFSAEDHQTVELHSTFGFITLGAAVAAFLTQYFWRDATAGGPLWIRRIVAWATLAAIILAGHTGAMAVWGSDWFS